MHFSRCAARFLALLAVIAAFPSAADVALRVEARPISDPIQAFVTVTDTVTGEPVTGLTLANFAVFVDASAVQPSSLTLPPSQDPNQRVSVVFAMDYTSSVTDVALTALQTATNAFIDAMVAGDYAAILKFNDTNGPTVVQAFTQIDDGGANDDTLKAAVLGNFDGDGSNILDAAEAAVEQFAAHPDPLLTGPKAVILVTDGIDTHSTSTAGEVIGVANASGIPIFTVGVGNPNQAGINLMTNLATKTGGRFVLAPTDQEIADAYASIAFQLTNEYVLTIPSSIDDCAEHTLEVAVAGQGSAQATFTRRECDTQPDAFSFTSQIGLNTDTNAESDAVTITGLEAPAPVSITQGSYSIGCGGGSTFTTAAGTIADGETICVRQTTSMQFATQKVTTLTIGGVSGTFTTTTRDERRSGGGGATGGLELLLGLAALMMRRRRQR